MLTEPQRVTDPTAVAQPAQPGQPAEPSDPEESAEPGTSKDAASPDDPSSRFLGQRAAARDQVDFGKDTEASTSPERHATFLGMDRKFIPKVDGVTPEQAMRWTYLASNLRFVGIYLQTSAGADSPDYRHETNRDYRNRLGNREDGGWMDAFQMIDALGWATMPIYVGFCAHQQPKERKLDAALGVLNARHAKAILGTLRDSLGLDLAGAVVYLDNEDVEGKQPIDKADLADYLGYFHAFSEELMTAGEQGPAYRFGLYGHPASIKQIAAVVPSVFAWQVSVGKSVLWKNLTARRPLVIHSPLEWSPRRQSDGLQPNIWPVMRQFALDKNIAQAVPKVDPGPAPAPEAPYQPRKTIDIDSSFVLDPSEPFANPRLVYVPGEQLLIRQRTMLARFEGDPSQWRTTTQTFRRRGSLSIVHAPDVPGPLAPTVLLPPIVQSGSGEELHPDSPGRSRARREWAFLCGGHPFGPRHPRRRGDPRSDHEHGTGSGKSGTPPLGARPRGNSQKGERDSQASARRRHGGGGIRKR